MKSPDKPVHQRKTGFFRRLFLREDRDNNTANESSSQPESSGSRRNREFGTLKISFEPDNERIKIDDFKSFPREKPIGEESAKNVDNVRAQEGPTIVSLEQNVSKVSSVDTV
jgi:hypothetical protein